eukprot:2382456-Rhodomonas_salina.1
MVFKQALRKATRATLKARQADDDDEDVELRDAVDRLSQFLPKQVPSGTVKRLGGGRDQGIIEEPRAHSFIVPGWADETMTLDALVRRVINLQATVASLQSGQPHSGHGITHDHSPQFAQKQACRVGFGAAPIGGGAGGFGGGFTKGFGGVFSVGGEVGGEFGGSSTKPATTVGTAKGWTATTG